MAAAHSIRSIDDAVRRLADLTLGPRALGDVVRFGPAAVPALERLLRGPPASVHQPRCLGADALAAIAGPAASNALLRALSDSVSRLSSGGLDPVLAESEALVVSAVADHLAATGLPAAPEALVAALRVRPTAGCIRGLGRLRERRALPLLLECLYCDVSRAPAMDALRQLGAVATSGLTRVLVMPRIVDGLEGPAWVSGRAAAGSLLGELAGEAAVLPLCWALSDPEAEVRQAAALALLRACGAEAASAVAPVLIEGLDDGHWPRAHAAARALEALGPPVVGLVAPLLQAKGDPSARQQRRAVQILGDMALPASARILAGLTSHPSPDLRHAAVVSLDRIAGERATAALAGFLADPAEQVRLRVVRALERRPDGAGLLTRLLADPALGVRGRARSALLALGPRAASALEQALSADHRHPGQRLAGWHARRQAHRLLRCLRAGDAGPGRTRDDS